MGEEKLTVKALVFDVFGTVVDWRSSIIHEGQQLNATKGLSVDWAAFADAWRGRYVPSMQRVARGELPWMNLDALHHRSLENLLVEFKVSNLSEDAKEQLNRVWHRLEPWPDAKEGLGRLRAKYILATLSNGNVALLVNMAKHAGLQWDCVLSAEIFHAYKPDPRTYLGAAALLGLPVHEVMMVAAHPDDLQQAKANGLQTAYVPRPTEHGAANAEATKYLSEPHPDFDITARDFVDLAQKLEA